MAVQSDYEVMLVAAHTSLKTRADPAHQVVAPKLWT